ncbi:MAG TPA: hypothetical protein VFG42_25575 [Baekduia sp.]|uniref:hypothetical protein n=1 Tax=Baekduia sp. TaxID=2600305 RepID=UPI002D779E39|nr:hypothetical protein [Baekduia sp.]HET6510188.1 hypothetical protein [Baekduia sp.]
MLLREDIGGVTLLLGGEQAPLQGTLAQRLDDGPLPPAEALRLLSEVAGALGTLDAFGQPHGHVAPDRILLTRTRPQRALLRADGKDPEPGVAATRRDLLLIADYLAPEVAAGGPRTTATDVYALACVLVEALTGAPPFAYDRPALVLAAHRHAPPPPVAAATGLPIALDRVLRTALSKDPEQRQRSTANLMRGAQRALGSQRHPILLAQPSPRAAAATPPSAAASPRTERTTGRRRTEPSRRPAPSASSTRREPARGSRRRLARRARDGSTPRRLRLRRLSATGVGAAVLLAVSATAGFATALRRTPDPARPTAGGAALALARPDAGRRTEAVDAIARAMGPLGAARAAARQELVTAEAPSAQASAADRLAADYQEALQALPGPAVLAAAPGAVQLPAALTAVERGYDQLAQAAQQGDVQAYSTAVRTIRAREARLDGTLARLT